MIIISQEILLAAWSSLLSQRQQFLNNHLARPPVTPNQQGTHEMRDEVLPRVGVKDVDTSGYQLSDLDDVEFYWKKDQLVAFFRAGIETPFSFSTFNNFEIESAAENPNLIDEEQHEGIFLFLLIQQLQSPRD